MSNHPHIINVKDVEPLTMSKGEKFSFSRRKLSGVTGGKDISCSCFEVPPGKQAFPHHAHLGNEEAFFILSGEGTFRIGNETFPVKSGDYIACPVGEENAHSLLNTGKTPLTYLGISTSNHIDITIYPDSKKCGIVAGADAQKGLMSASFLKLWPDQPNVDYYLGEE